MNSAFKTTFKTKYDAAWLGLLALITYAVQSLAWPLHYGRDGSNYLAYYLDIASRQPVYQMLMLRRTPVAPILYGLPLTYFGSAFTEILSGLMYCVSILLIYRLGSYFGRRIALAAGILVIFYPAYGSQYHVVASEPPSMFLLIVACVLFFEAIQRPALKKFLALGVVIVLATLARPDSLVLMGLSMGPLLFLSAPWRDRIRFAGVLLGTGVVLLLLWSTYNYVRYDDFTIARGADAQIPLERALTISHIVRAENGPASADLARLIGTQLLTKEPYKSYGIDLPTFFSQGGERMFGDLIPLSDQYYGWDSDYSQLKKVGFEAVRAYPRQFLWDYTKSAGGMLLFNPTWPVALRSPEQPPAAALGKNGLPVPGEGELIPRSFFWPSSSSPDLRAMPDPNSLALVILNPDVRSATDDFQNRLDAYARVLPNRDGNPRLADGLNWVSTHYPPPILWLLLGLVGLWLRPDLQKWMLALILGAGMVMIFYPLLGFGSILIMRVRFDPLIILFGLAGLAEILHRLLSLWRASSRQAVARKPLALKTLSHFSGFSWLSHSQPH